MWDCSCVYISDCVYTHLCVRFCLMVCASMQQMCLCTLAPLNVHAHGLCTCLHAQYLCGKCIEAVLVMSVSWVRLCLCHVIITVDRIKEQIMGQKSCGFTDLSNPLSAIGCTKPALLNSGVCAAFFSNTSPWRPACAGARAGSTVSAPSQLAERPPGNRRASAPNFPVNFGSSTHLIQFAWAMKSCLYSCQ